MVVRHIAPCRHRGVAASSLVGLVLHLLHLQLQLQLQKLHQQILHLKEELWFLPWRMDELAEVMRETLSLSGGGWWWL